MRGSWASVLGEGLDSSRDGLNLALKVGVRLDGAAPGAPVSFKGALLGAAPAQVAAPDAPAEGEVDHEAVGLLSASSNGRKRVACLITQTPGKLAAAAKAGAGAVAAATQQVTTQPAAQPAAPKLAWSSLQGKAKKYKESVTPTALDFEALASDKTGESASEPAPADKAAGNPAPVPADKAAPAPAPAPPSPTTLLRRAARKTSVWADDEGGMSGLDSDGEEEAESKAAAGGSSDGSSGGARQPIEKLTDERIAKRQKQIDLGKSTEGYKAYTAKVPLEERAKDPRRCPSTPDRYDKISKRDFLSKVRAWRRALHLWDPVEQAQPQPRPQAPPQPAKVPRGKVNLLKARPNTNKAIRAATSSASTSSSSSSSSTSSAVDLASKQDFPSLTPPKNLAPAGHL
jgi:hypothetical protein